MNQMIIRCLYDMQVYPIRALQADPSSEVMDTTPLGDSVHHYSRHGKRRITVVMSDLPDWPAGEIYGFEVWFSNGMCMEFEAYVESYEISFGLIKPSEVRRVLVPVTATTCTTYPPPGEVCARIL